MKATPECHDRELTAGNGLNVTGGIRSGNKAMTTNRSNQRVRLGAVEIRLAWRKHRGHEHVVIRFRQGVDEIERQLAVEGLLP